MQFVLFDKCCRESESVIHAVDDVSLQISEGEFIAIQGPSGCGKSTLLLSAGGLLKPDTGKVTVVGRDPYSMTPDDRAEFRAETIGFVFQQFHLVPYLTVLENILSPAMATKLNPNVRDRADQLLERFGLTERTGHVPSKLSSGERQRVAMARALLNQPKLLLADEPTGNLDQENAEIVLNCLAEFASEGGGVLLVTHDDRAVAHAHRAIHLLAGKVITPVISE